LKEVLSAVKRTLRNGVVKDGMRARETAPQSGADPCAIAINIADAHI
jgi:hypothetical protein